MKLVKTPFARGCIRITLGCYQPSTRPEKQVLTMAHVLRLLACTLPQKNAEAHGGRLDSSVVTGPSLGAC